MPDLTEEQRAIVAHDHGPALVFAVAGAGKTTAMTWRIERLAREGVFPARSILATSFSKASVRDIQRALAPWPHCREVQAQTLHSVGWHILKAARRRGHLPELASGGDDDGAEGRILTLALARAWRDKAPYAAELEALDRQDFGTYIGVCKTNLRYADLARAALPPSALAHASQAPAPNGFAWYRDLYALYERVRVQEGAITFDDMLLTGWECLHRFPDVLAEMRQRFQCVLVDEFQDVSRVQSEMLDLLTFPHRHYMAIGDDDQTIYEWRGADPGFILGFAARYHAAKYFIHDNFRSHAAPLALANRVIERNIRREPKRLSLTRGFGGNVSVHLEAGPERQGRHLAEIIQQEIAGGRTPADLAVLVRLYAQTPPLEHALIQAGISYHVVGGSPFYARPEVVTLLDYLRLAEPTPPPGAATLPKREGEEGGARFIAPSSPPSASPRFGGSTRAAGEGGSWLRIANKPARFLARPLCDAVAQAVQEGSSLPDALDGAAQNAPDRAASRLRDLADTLRWLAGVWDTLPAGAALSLLDQRLGYRDWLRGSSGFPETGAARADGVQSFLRYAEGHATPAALLAHLDSLAAQGVGQNRPNSAESVALMTVFRAKGLQWPVVFVPDCNQGTFPYGGPDELEEERRLFYVALTRPQTDLHLHVVQTELPSQFLTEADWQATLAAVQSVGETLARDPETWPTADALALARHTPRLGLERYFRRWQAPPDLARRAALRMAALFAAARRLGLEAALGLDDSHRQPWTRPTLSADPDADAFADLADFAALLPTVPAPPEAPLSHIPTLRVGGQVQHPQHGRGAILAIRGDRLSPRLEIQFARGKPVILPAKFVELVVG